MSQRRFWRDDTGDGEMRGGPMFRFQSNGGDVSFEAREFFRGDRLLISLDSNDAPELSVDLNSELAAELGAFLTAWSKRGAA